MTISEAALEAGIAACGPGRPFRDIVKAIHEVLRGKDYSVSSAFTGHGIGQDFHRQPWIHHVCEWDQVESFPCRVVLTACNAIRGVVNDEPEVMQPGDCFTIEVRRFLYLGVTWSSNSALFSLLLCRATILLE